MKPILFSELAPHSRFYFMGEWYTKYYSNDYSTHYCGKHKTVVNDFTVYVL